LTETLRHGGSLPYRNSPVRPVRLAERVEVTASIPALKTQSAEVSATMESKLVEDLPLPVAGVDNGMRNAFSLMLMMPQVRSRDGENAAGDFQIGGGQYSDWNVSVDGLSIERGWRNHVRSESRLMPPVDAIEEFRVDTAAFKAEGGRASGGNMTIVTKSGTSEFHGTAFEYSQSQRFDANTWLNNKLGRPKAVYRRNDFGATLGGPITIPKLYRARDRSYFYLSYEAYRYPTTSGTSELTVPLTEMRRGDFSNWKRTNGALIPIYDPSTTRSESAGGFQRETFPGNLIPASRISSISRNIVQYDPDPNAPGLVRNYRAYGPAPSKMISDASMVKIDHPFGVKNRLAFTWTRSGWYFDNAYDKDRDNPANATDNYYSWDSSKNWGEYHNVYGINDSLTWIRGSHSIKLGYNYQMLMENVNDRNAQADIVTFHRLETARPQDNSGNTGSKGTHLASEKVNYMQIDPKYAYLGSLLNRPIDDPAVAALGFRPPFPSFTRVMGANATLGQSLRMFPQYSNVPTGGMANHSGNSTYHALILDATRRFSGGLSMVTSYVWSKLLTDADGAAPGVGFNLITGAAQDHYNRRLEKAYGSLDTPHQFQVTASYDLPFGKGRAFAASGRIMRLLDEAAGGWAPESEDRGQVVTKVPAALRHVRFAHRSVRAGQPRRQSGMPGNRVRVEDGDVGMDGVEPRLSAASVSEFAETGCWSPPARA
jgi:hypothetical protein